MNRIFAAETIKWQKLYEKIQQGLLNTFCNVLFSGNGHHVMLDIGKVRLLREILKEASFSDQEEVLR